MMGPLHIEMAFINAIGDWLDWLDGSGWCEVFNKADISTPGRVENFLQGSHVKRSRYAHQISLSTLYTMSYNVFQQSGIASYDDWMQKVKKESVNAVYWFTVIEMEILLFMFVKSLRSGDFDLYVRCLKDMLPWMFALDHCHYARWMSVFVHDLEDLPSTHPHIFKNFMEGRFVVTKSNRKFSSIGEDQAHEQNNKQIKADGGVIGILDNEAALLNWATSGPVIARLIESVKTEHNENKDHHHEDTDSFEKKFRDERKRFLGAFEEFGNPFQESGDCLINVATKVVIDHIASESVKSAKEKGELQSKDFTERCLIKGDQSLYTTISKNKLALFRKRNAVKTSKTKQELVSLKSDCRLYANLYVACQVRDGNLDEFFSHENHAYPPAISEYGRLRKCNEKSAFLKCLEEIEAPKMDRPDVDCCIIDGPAFVHMHPPRSAKTYGQYCEEEIPSSLTKLTSQVSRVDIVFDICKETTLKSQTRENRGKGIRVSVRQDTPVVKNFKEFLRDDENKRELFFMIGDSVSSFRSECLIVSTQEDSVKSNQSIDTLGLEKCNHEEADTRMFIHVNHASMTGKKRVMLITVDTDVVTIALFAFHSLNLSELWIEFGTGKNRRWLPIHIYAAHLGEQTCRAIPFWYSMTGCDTVSMFAGRGKKTCWNVWKSYSDATESFAR